ncbi:16S rRNA (guanine(527)-N(7))-methyltransferase RsmG [Histidinibacterium lentulum]|uniref:Ribosomal RNA small subunit methyltransferase G n=1 Tax=Histidinibacterium lentulum TaxID=2480588 RepID=A0A3N2R733_9RHOB|nr:16S rRNA (guanine(527)-N(7))-methyltransferase RsmG [Histidinibacterium lentulum]ROU03290.1 16S rRNA (guanine(527)-N(7))-methyltransferase RsmG [Histidinibacterium lentulum]
MRELGVPGLDVSRETLERLASLEDLVDKWTRRINLIAPDSRADIWNRHIRDSAQLVPLAPRPAGPWLDLGSGAGFPGLVVATILAEHSPDTLVTLVESDTRKATFLRTAIRTLGLDAEVRTDRAEALPPHNAAIVSARALAPLTRLLGFADRHLAAEGIALLPKGRARAPEIDEARANWDFALSETRSITDPEAAILRIERIVRV